jgi:hypothetical protein
MRGSERVGFETVGSKFEESLINTLLFDIPHSLCSFITRFFERLNLALCQIGQGFVLSDMDLVLIRLRRCERRIFLF